MSPFAAAALNSPLSKWATYTPPGGQPVRCRVLVRDASAEVRVGAGLQVIADQAEASVAEEISPAEDGTLVVGTTSYRIITVMESDAPGLLDLALERLSGHGTDGADLSSVALQLRGETVTLDGRVIRGVVTRRVAEETSDSWGQAVQVLRTRIAIAAADAAEADAGSVVALGSRELTVVRVMRDGAGMAVLVCVG